MKLDEWIETDMYEEGITHIMYTVFDDYCEDGIGTASVKFRIEDGTETQWFHPPAEVFCNDVEQPIL